MRFDVRPSPSRSYPPNLAVIYPIFAGEASGCLGRSDFKNLLLVEFSKRVIGAFIGNLVSGCPSALRIHISNIFALFAKKQVIRVDASRIVASVANTLAFRYPTEVLSIIEAVRSLCFPIQIDLPVAICGCTSGPFPAARNFVNSDIRKQTFAD